MSRDVTLKFVNCASLPTAGADSWLTSTDSVGGVSSDSGILTVLTDCVTADHSFSEDVYWRHLSTLVLGNVVLYADVTNTTMHILDRSVP